jgi:nitrate/nitrite transport system substrate-binding protein
MDRRNFLRLAGTGLALPAAARLLTACGDESTPAAVTAAPGTTAAGAPTSSKPVRKVKLGFIALTDCASLVMAKELGYFTARNLDVTLEKQASWAALRDALANGQIDGAHCLYSMPAALATLGNQPDHPLRIAMMLNRNGQAITLNAKDFAGVGYGDLPALRAKLEAKPDKLAMTYPGGTHDLWLRYVLKAAKYEPKADQVIPIPPPQMVANMTAGTMSGYCVGEPWNAKAVTDRVGFTFLTSQDIWQDHPEKALVVGAKLSADEDTLGDVMGAVLAAGKWLDEAENRKKAATTLAAESYVNTPAVNIEGRLTGKYDLGAQLGSKDFAGRQMQFFQAGVVNAPRRSHTIWALAQYQRFGLLKTTPDYTALADKLVLRSLYEKVAKVEGIAVPDDDMAPFKVLIDNATFDPSKPALEVSRP